MTGSGGGRIVVGVDGSLNSLAAVDFGVREAVLRRLPVHLVAAYPQVGLGRTTGLCLTALLRRVCVNWPGLIATGGNVTGDPADHLITASRTASLVVIGRGHPARPQPVGTVAARVVAHAYCPTAVVPPGSGAVDPSAVTVGLGFAPEDEPALAYAFEAAAVRGVPLQAVHVWSGIPATAVGAVSPFRYDRRTAEQAADRELADALAPWQRRYPRVRVERLPLYDVNPAQALNRIGGTNGLMVVGSHRHHLRSSHVLGRTTHALLEWIRCPIVVTGPHTAPVG